jgi:hypothetical protein
VAVEDVQDREALGGGELEDLEHPLARTHEQPPPARAAGVASRQDIESSLMQS